VTIDTSLRIKPLSIQLANQIAAGEVVERPASVLKELMENSIDAQSTSIEVEIVQGGKSLIRIKDNGLGISKEDLHLAVSRHATSKLATIDDLQHIQSLGFRGEALASISSISRLSIQSKFTGSDKAWKIDTGSDTNFTNYQAEVLPTALSSGTLIEVKDLFYNTPARRKFLRTDKTEFRFIDDIFKRIALSHFDVSFKLIHNKKLIKKLSACDEKNSDDTCFEGTCCKGKSLRLKKIFGENFAQQFMQINDTEHNFADLGSLKLSGWISNKHYFRHQADQQFFYVNGRYVRDKLLNHALRQAYQEILPAQQYASYILYLSIDPSYVDVNVHPTKHEVRFNQTRMVHDFIVSVLSRNLSPALVNSQSSLNQDKNDGIINSYQTSYSLGRQQSTTENKFDVKDQIRGLSNLYQQPQKNRDRLESDSKSYTSKGLELDNLDYNFPNTELNQASNNKVITEEPLFKGTILSLIGHSLIAKDEETLWLVDVLKVARHINFSTLNETLIYDKGNFKLEQYKLLIPQSISLSVVQCNLLMKWQAEIALFAIEFSLSGDESIMLRGIPRLAFAVNSQLMLLSLVEYLEESYLQKNSLQESNQSIIKVLSDSLDESQVIDTYKQGLIMDHLIKFKGSKELNNSFKILNEIEINKFITQS
jgi:DNA mismatch repair protein MutL